MQSKYQAIKFFQRQKPNIVELSFPPVQRMYLSKADEWEFSCFYFDWWSYLLPLKEKFELLDSNRKPSNKKFQVTSVRQIMKNREIKITAKEL